VEEIRDGIIINYSTFHSYHILRVALRYFLLKNTFFRVKFFMVSGGTNLWKIDRVKDGPNLFRKLNGRGKTMPIHWFYDISYTRSALAARKKADLRSFLEAHPLIAQCERKS